MQWMRAFSLKFEEEGNLCSSRWFCKNKQHVKNSHRVQWRYRKHALNHCLVDSVYLVINVICIIMSTIIINITWIYIVIFVSIVIFALN